MHEPPLIGDPEAHALFLDFDGTLVDIAERPDLTRLPAATHGLMPRLYDRFGGALAIITGREIPAIDQFLTPHLLPVAGVHGLMRRDAAGAIHEADGARAFDASTAASITALLSNTPGVLVEIKPGSAAIHYRSAPEAAPHCHSAALAVAASHPDLHVLPGKMVFEVKPKNHNKGTVIRTFMAEPPFAGRVPVFIGDDTTDEDGFRVVNELGGISIKVGEGESVASFRLAGPDSVAAWLEKILAN